MSDNDDVMVGRILTRREMLGFLGAAGAALLVACSGDEKSPASPAGAGIDEAAATSTPATSALAAATSTMTVPACVVAPALTEGPYFVDEKLNRGDIRTNTSNGAVSQGARFDLTINVGHVANGGCAALAGAMVDIWHCDAAGVYSDASDPSFNTKGQNFLRGYQLTDSNGQVKFTTVYPGWYQGRAVHIHFKVRNAGSEFTSQFFFDDAMSQQVYAAAPYASKGTGFLRNAGDSIYRQSGGMTTLQVTRSGEIYAATFDIGLRI
ncbi:MAG TPA: intradiol ring-cleavage dioxygenase [Dehalococcoidia bacterium]|nr:intradiol ring-cleavage dioxygenase [Dehalococcoidia bacterium]